MFRRVVGRGNNAITKDANCSTIDPNTRATESVLRNGIKRTLYCKLELPGRFSSEGELNFARRYCKKRMVRGERLDKVQPVFPLLARV